MNESDKYSVFCLVGFIVSFFIPPIGIFLCIVGIKNMKFNPQKGKILGVIGILIALAMLYVHVVYIFIPYINSKLNKEMVEKKEQYVLEKEEYEICKTISSNDCYYLNDQQYACAYNGGAVTCSKTEIDNHGTNPHPIITTSRVEETTIVTTTKMPDKIVIR